MIYNGVLVPNSELGHVQRAKHGKDAEAYAAYSAMERESLTWEQWAERLQWYYSHIEFLFSPDLFVVGGGVSKHADAVPAAAGPEDPDRAGGASQQRGHHRGGGAGARLTVRRGREGEWAGLYAGFCPGA